MRKAEIRMHERTTGWLTQDGHYQFIYSTEYLESEHAEPISLTLPLQQRPFQSEVLFPFFDGLIPEGWLMDIAVRNWKLNPHDRMSLLLACCKDCIGAVSIHQIKEEEESTILDEDRTSSILKER